MSNQPKTHVVNKSRILKEPRIVFPDGTKTSIFVQPKSNVEMPPGATLDKNWSLRNPEVIVVTEPAKPTPQDSKAPEQPKEVVEEPASTSSETPASSEE